MISRQIFKTLFLFAAGAALIASCDSEYNDIGADIIEGDIHHNNMVRYSGSVVAYDRGTGPVQSNNLPLNSLGIYDNPTFGKTTANFVTQLELASENPKFNAPVIDSVYLYVPYFSTYKSTDASTGTSTYELDSINGNLDAEMTLRVYRNGYFLRNTDPGSQTSEGQKYYSNQNADIEGQTQGLLGDNTTFKISAAEVERKAIVSGVPKTVERFTPGIFMLLNNDAFTSAIINAPTGKLLTNNIFKEYFRGVYFNITQNGGSGAMATTRFSEGNIVIIYKDYPIGTDGEFDTTVPKVRKTLTLNMKGNTINLFNTDYKSDFLGSIASSNVPLGDDRLYIKGGAGSMGVIKILSAGDLATLRAERVLINEANLVFYVDEAKMGTAPNPMRLYLYDLNNRRPLVDYYADATINNGNSKYDKRVFSGLLARNNTGKLAYKVRITNHVNNIINNDSTNVSLGVVLTENINLISNAALKSPFDAGLIDVKSVPLNSVISPLGTVLFGNNIAPADEGNPDSPYNRRLQLEIFYTKPN